MALGRPRQPLGHFVQGLVPADPLEAARSLRPAAPQGIAEPVRMVLALGIAGDLGADDAGRIGVVPRAPHLADAIAIEPLDLQRAGAGAIVGTGGMDDIQGHGRSVANGRP